MVLKSRLGQKAYTMHFPGNNLQIEICELFFMRGFLTFQNSQSFFEDQKKETDYGTSILWMHMYTYMYLIGTYPSYIVLNW